MTRHKTSSRLLAVFLSLLLVLSMMPISVFATDDGVTYLAANGEEQTLEEAYTTINSDSAPTEWETGWYVVEGDVTIGSRVTVNGDVKLILKDTSNLTVNGGIDVSEGNSFTVYAQSTDESTMGKLTAIAGENEAGIGGGDGGNGGTITIDGGTITATGGAYGAGIGGGLGGSGGTITINGGTVTAIGGNLGAGIGGSEGGSGGTITINGGMVEANGGSRYVAGIGGGRFGSGGEITINGGNIDANGGYYGSGIGGGAYRDGGTITINGGTVEANSGGNGSGIGGGYGYGGSGGTITINGGTVTANGGEYGGSGIGGGENGSGGTITINGGTVTATGGNGGAGIGGGIMGAGGEITISGGTITATGGDRGAGIGDGVDSESSGTFATGTDGTAVIFASSISDQSGKNANAWRGLIFEGDNGKVYGENYTVEGTLTIPEGKTLTVEENKKITVPNGATLDNDNNGTITNNGTIYVELGGTYIGLETTPNEVQYQKEQVSYLEYNNGSFTTEHVEEYTLIQDNLLTNWSNGWYVVEGTVEINSRVTVTDDVKLILKDDSNLTVNGGIDVSEGNSFTVYAQSTDESTMGKLTATAGTSSEAGIGGGQGGTITINGGTVTATGGMDAAGIGGSADSSGGTITINGGTVTAIGSAGGAGIGFGSGGYGGKFTTGENGTAVIFASSISDQSGKDTNAWRGLIFEGNDGEIYGDSYTVNETLTIPEGKTLTVESGKTLNNTNDKITNNGRIYVKLGGEYNGPETTPIPVEYQKEPVSYLDYVGGSFTTEYVEEYTLIQDNPLTTWSDGWYVVEGTVKIDSRVTVNGDVKLILKDDSNLTVNGGIDVTDPNSFTVYAQSTGDSMGQLTADASNVNYVAGIGGGAGGSGGTITINGGTVATNGGVDAAGIGGGAYRDGGTITINGGTVEATAGDRGAGIGGGIEGSGGEITISSGTVEATGGNGGAGIGGGYEGSGGTITINGGTVTATGGGFASGIGDGGYCGSGGTIEINGGTIMANGGDYGAGIGGGWYGSGGEITIKGGTVTANGGDYGAGIGGGGKGGSGGTITITGGMVTANGGDMGAGIGGGQYGSGGEIMINGGTVTATGGEGGSGIGDGAESDADGTFITGTDGTAVIFASSISDQSGKDNWRGLIFEGNDGKIYGDSYTVNETLTIPADKTLTIEDGKTLTVPDDIVITNNGTIKVNMDGSYDGDQPNGNPVQYQIDWDYDDDSVADDTTYVPYGEKPVHNGVVKEQTDMYYYEFAGWDPELKNVTGTAVYKAMFTEHLRKFDVTIPTGKGFTVNYDDGDTNIEYGSDFNFTVDIAEGYSKTDAFEVLANGTVLSANDDGIYTVNVTEDTQITVNGVADTTAPTATITVNENKFKEFINQITFGIFCNDKYDVTISAEDAGSGVNTIEYCVTGTAISKNDIVYHSEWTSYDNAFDINNEGKYIIYAKVTDVAGNTTFISSDGLILETTAPTNVVVDTNGYVSGQWTNESVELTVSGSNALSGIERYEYSTDGGENWNVVTNESITISADTNGTEYVFRSLSKAGNYSQQSDAVVVKIDKQTPTISVTGDTTTIKQSDTVNINANAGISGKTVQVLKDNGTFVTVNEDTYTVTENGTYTFKVTNGVGVTAQTKITYANIDTQKPVLSLDTNGYKDGTWATNDVELTVRNTTANLGETAFEYKVDNGIWESFDGSITVSENTKGTVYTFRATAANGLISDEVSVTVKIDKTAPTITVSGDTDTYLQNDTMTVSASAGLSGIAKVEVSKDGGEAQDITESYEAGYAVTENGTYTFTLTNGAGVTVKDSITYDKLDQTKPEVLLNTNGYTSNEWTNSDVTLTVSDSSDALGTTQLEYKVNDGEWQVYTDAIIVSDETDGTTYTFKATSASGVESDEVSVTVKIDKTAPTGEIVLGTNRWNSFLNTITFGLFFNSTQSVEVVAADDSVAKIEYLIHEGDALSKDDIEQQSFTKYTGKFNIDPDQKCVIYVRLTDNAENVTYLSSDGIILDSTASSAPVVATDGYISGNWTNKNVTLTVSGASALSGIAKYQVSTDNGENWTDMTIVNGMATLTVSESAETTYIFRAVSNSGVNGNSSTPVTVKIDKTVPTITVSGNTDTYLQNDTMTVSASAGLSGITKVEVSKVGGAVQDITESYADGYAVTENGTYTFTLTNGAGVTVKDSITYDKLDQTKPEVSLNTNGYTSNEWTNSDVTLTVSDSSAALGTTQFEYKVNDGEWQVYTGAIIVSDETDGTTYTFKATSASGVESDEVSIVVKLDKTVPSGDIEIEESSVKQFINTITFGLFFNKNVDVTIKGTDDLSGVAAVEYYRSVEILTEDEVLAIKDWTAYTSVSETAEDAKQFVYYVKITDNAGNITYFGSNGTTFDLTAPVIAGVTDGATYYTTQSITVTDENFASATVNGDVQSDSTFTLPGNVEKAYTIVATDKAGNSTTVMVTMKTITSLTEPMEGITTDNVNSDDKETIEAVKEQVEAIDTENATEDEKAVIDEILNNCDDLLEKIEESTQAGTTESIEKVENITSDNVKPEDKDDLTQAKEDLEDALENFGDNYTEEEKAELEEKLEQIEDALESIEKVEAVEDAINALPDTVEPDDTETEAKIDEVKDLYDELTEHEKDLISEELKDKLDNLLAALCDYEVVEGDGSKWEKGSDTGLVFTANGAYSKFTGIAVDGKLVDKENYTAVSGSTVITLKPEFLETLSAGTHTLTVQYTDGEVSCEFTVVEKSAVGTNNDTKSPLTGNSSDIIPWAAFLLLMGGALGTNLIISKRKRCK